MPWNLDSSARQTVALRTLVAAIAGNPSFDFGSRAREKHLFERIEILHSRNSWGMPLVRHYGIQNLFEFTNRGVLYYGMFRFETFRVCEVGFLNARRREKMLMASMGSTIIYYRILIFKTLRRSCFCNFLLHATVSFF